MLVHLIALAVLQTPNKVPTPTVADIPYATASPKQKLDLFLPAKKGFATVMFVYGSGWHAGDRKNVAAVGEAFKEMGFGCAVIGYRLTPPDKFPTHEQDVAAAFAWVRTHIAARGGDPKRLYVAGHSSGAQLVSLLASDPKYLKPYHLSPKDIRGVIGFSTPVDLVPSGKNGFGDALMGGKGADAFGRDVKVMRDASPINHLTKSIPPTLLIVGEMDLTSLPADNERYGKQAKAIGAPVKVVVIPDCSHMETIGRLLNDEDDPVRANVERFLRSRESRVESREGKEGRTSNVQSRKSSGS